MRALIILALLLPSSAFAQSKGTGLHVTGDARMGVVWSDRPAALGPRENGLRMTSRARLHFQFVGETDGGMRFGANINLDPDTNRPTGQSVFIGR